MITRRTFLNRSLTCFAAASMSTPAVRSAIPAGAASERVTVGFIGTGNQGMGLLNRFLAADLGDVAAVCDVNRGSKGY